MTLLTARNDRDVESEIPGANAMTSPLRLTQNARSGVPSDSL
jgi:hypothetical protein